MIKQMKRDSILANSCKASEKFQNSYLWSTLSTSIRLYAVPVGETASEGCLVSCGASGPMSNLGVQPYGKRATI